MMTYLAIPFDSSSLELKGHNLGDERFDQTTGKWYRLVAVHTDLDSNTTAEGQVAVVAGSNIVANKAASCIDTTNVIADGVFAAAVAESASTDAYRYCWIQVGGACTVNKDGNAINVGDVILADPATAGACKLLADATAVTGVQLKSAMGYCITAALAGDATVSAYLRYLR